jgi:hypothetical protein
MQVPTKTQGRGVHWRDKVAAGNPPGVASYTTLWAERFKHMEAKLKAQLPGYCVPWHRAHMNMGNTGKVLFMQLLIHHVNKVVNLRFSDGAGVLGRQSCLDLKNDFFGIVGFEILDPGAFDSDESAACEIHSIAWARANPTKVKFQSVLKLWTTYNFEESVDSSGNPAPALYAYVREKRTTKEKRQMAADASLLESALKKQHRVVEVQGSDQVVISALLMLSAPATNLDHGTMPTHDPRPLILRADALDRRAESLERIAQLAEQRADELERGAERVELLFADEL